MFEYLYTYGLPTVLPVSEDRTYTGTQTKKSWPKQSCQRQFQGSSKFQGSSTVPQYFKLASSSTWYYVHTVISLGSSEVRKKGGGGHYFLTHHTTVQVHNIMMTHIIFKIIFQRVLETQKWNYQSIDMRSHSSI